MDSCHSFRSSKSTDMHRSTAAMGVRLWHPQERTQAGGHMRVGPGNKRDSCVMRNKRGFATVFRSETMPAYDATGTIYQTNAQVKGFAALVSEKPESVQCFTLTGCRRSGMVCALTPLAFDVGKPPLRYVG